MKKLGKKVMGFVFGILVAFTIDVAAETVISSGAVSYSNSKTAGTTVDGALDELFSAVDINQKIGTTDISNIGDGTITGAINTLNSDLENKIHIIYPTFSRSVLGMEAGFAGISFTLPENAIVISITPYLTQGIAAWFNFNIVKVDINSCLLAYKNLYEEQLTLSGMLAIAYYLP